MAWDSWNFTFKNPQKIIITCSRSFIYRALISPALTVPKLSLVEFYIKLTSFFFYPFSPIWNKRLTLTSKRTRKKKLMTTQWKFPWLWVWWFAITIKWKLYERFIHITLIYLHYCFSSFSTYCCIYTSLYALRIRYVDFSMPDCLSICKCERRRNRAYIRIYVCIFFFS